MGVDIPTGGFRRCEFSSSHLGKLIGGGSILTEYCNDLRVTGIMYNE